MKLNLTDKEYNKKYAKWHPWFAWIPTKLEDGCIVWLETILRRKLQRHCMHWEYKK